MLGWLYYTRRRLFRNSSSCRADCLLGCMFTAVRRLSACAFKHLKKSKVLWSVNQDLISLQEYRMDDRIQVFFSSLCLIKFGKPKEKSPLLHTNPANIRDWKEKGDEWLTMAFDSKPLLWVENPYLSFFSPCCKKYTWLCSSGATVGH